MKERVLENPAPFEMNARDVARLLGYRGTPDTDRARSLIAEAVAESTDLARPAYVFQTIVRVAEDESPFLCAAGDVCLCLATVGVAIEERASEYDRAGELSRALALNVCGSVAVESVAESAERAIRGRLSSQGLRCSRRFSPGYGDWDVAEQRWIIPYLDGSSLGVTLTTGLMMHPRKSITFAVTVGTDPIEMRSGDAENPCDDCDMTCCAYRRTTRHIMEGVPCNDSSYCPLDRWSE